MPADYALFAAFGTLLKPAVACLVLAAASAYSSAGSMEFDQ